MNFEDPFWPWLFTGIVFGMAIQGLYPILAQWIENKRTARRNRKLVEAYLAKLKRSRIFKVGTVHTTAHPVFGYPVLVVEEDWRFADEEGVHMIEIGPDGIFRFKGWTHAELLAATRCPSEFEVGDG